MRQLKEVVETPEEVSRVLMDLEERQPKWWCRLHLNFGEVPHDLFKDYL